MYFQLLSVLVCLSVSHGGPQICSVCQCTTPLVYIDCRGIGLTKVPDLARIPKDTLIDLRKNPIGAEILEKWLSTTDRIVENVYWDESIRTSRDDYPSSVTDIYNVANTVKTTAPNEWIVPVFLFCVGFVGSTVTGACIWRMLRQIRGEMRDSRRQPPRCPRVSRDSSVWWDILYLTDIYIYIYIYIYKFYMNLRKWLL